MWLNSKWEQLRKKHIAASWDDDPPGWRRRSATHWRLEETAGYTLKAGGDGRLHTEGWRRRSATHWRLEETAGYTLKAGGDTEGWRRWSATHWRLEETVGYTLKAGGDGRLHTEGWRRQDQNNPRFLFSTVARLKNNQTSPDLNIPSQFNSNDFMNFFTDK